ncbi:MAG TPA: phosphatidylserine decarboxylase [Bacteroidia bacterium]|jgi:phosphatidylserine decarboxylase|nr:phosphatidylserine decarboxylase [Bacteroidia bacterium]
MPNTKYHFIVDRLIKLIKDNNWNNLFEKAITNAGTKNVPLLENVKNLDGYLKWINNFLYWIPRENSSGQNVNDHLSAFYFIADQESLAGLQNKVEPHNEPPTLTPFSAWLVDYADAMGAFLDTHESFTPESEQSFYDSPAYNMKEYTRPHGGWGSFNQFFARHFKPGFRPIAAISDPTVVVMPADSTFGGQWEIRSDSHVTVKNLNWEISELLAGSPYKDRFENGLFMHSYLGPTDYHRQHAPLAGKVLEARVIPGQVYLEVEAVPIPESPGKHKLSLKKNYDSLDTPGYQFAQSRALIVLETAIGLVAVLPIGMCQVSSVIITAETGVTVRKGEELSYFQFGGSDIILLFESSSNVCFSAQRTLHYKMGAKIAQAYPVC